MIAPLGYATDQLLPVRNLRRGNALGLPSGQDVAWAGVPEIRRLNRQCEIEVSGGNWIQTANGANRSECP